MSYQVKIDDNGTPIQEGLERIHVVNVSTATTGEKTIAIPRGAYQVILKTVPVKASMRVNGYPDVIPIEQGEGFGSFNNLRELVINVEAVGTSPIVVLLFA
jgi:hypothetical protein